jgi:hypothetical protein
MKTLMDLEDEIHRLLNNSRGVALHGRTIHAVMQRVGQMRAHLTISRPAQRVTIRPPFKVVRGQ